MYFIFRAFKNYLIYLQLKIKEVIISFKFGCCDLAQRHLLVIAQKLHLAESNVVIPA